VSPRRTGEGTRQGFTTGSAASAAAKAALLLLLTGKAPERVDIPLPPGAAGYPGTRLDIPVAAAVREGLGARATVVKDAGDDPDATHKARISCLAECISAPAGAVLIEGGRGVGRVTLPGLPVPPGRAAINPAPMAQIELAAREAMEMAGRSCAARFVVEVEDGEAIARRTMNPRLGITGGVSILGTQGVVKPFSLEAWKATIESGLQVALAAGVRTAAFSTGRRGERLLMAERPGLPERAFVQAADFFAWSTARAARLGFTEIVWGCFFGKLAKMARGMEYTHAHAGETDFAFLAGLARLAGADDGACAAVVRANTARHALEIAPEGPVRLAFVELAAKLALGHAVAHAGLPSHPPERPGGTDGTGGEPEMPARTPAALAAVALAGAGAAARNDSADAGPSLRIGVVCFGFEGGVLARAYTS
jgi:cobalt-precorrin-5B (C1)-methyltransferase